MKLNATASENFLDGLGRAALECSIFTSMVPCGRAADVGVCSFSCTWAASSFFRISTSFKKSDVALVVLLGDPVL